VSYHVNFSRIFTVLVGWQAEVYILTQNEGGRHTPFFTNYK